MRYLVTTIFAIGLLFTEQASAGRVHGHAYLQDQTNHSGIQVQIIKYPGGLLCYTQITDANGYWEQDLIGGLDYCYHIKFFKPCYGVVMEDTVYIGALDNITVPDKHLVPVSCGTSWCDNYPYYPPGGSIHFPADDGRHDPLLTYPIEWWYVSMHLTGQTSGKQYGAFVAFFKGVGMRLFALSDLSSDQYYSSAKTFHVMTTGLDTLNIVYEDQLLNNDLWWNAAQCGGTPLDPFLQRLNVDAIADQDGQNIALDVYLQALTAPMLVGGSGYLSVGNGFTYYYSYPRMKVIGVIEAHGIKEYVEGEAWFDHQWGNYAGDQIPTWKWFSIQLDDKRDIMVADLFINAKPQANTLNGMNYFNSSCQLVTLPNYSIEALQSWTDPVSHENFGTKWRIRETTKSIDLVLTADFPDQVMRSIWSQIYPWEIFWEGVCSVTGTIAGVQVSGKAYAEVSQPEPTAVDTSGTLCTILPPDIADTRLRLMLDRYLPTQDIHSTLLILTECYGGDVMDKFETRANTAVLSATSPGQLGRSRGYDDDAAKCLYPAVGRTSDDVHECAVIGKDPLENPLKQGVVPLEPTSPGGAIRGRHILFYAGKPCADPYDPSYSDTTYLRIIRNNFEGQYNTHFYAVGGLGSGAFSYPGTGAGLRWALRDIGNNIGSDEQFIMFVSDHGSRRLVPDVVPCGYYGCCSTEPYALPSATWQQMLDDTANVPMIEIVAKSCTAAACTVSYCQQVYYPVYFNCQDSIEVDVDGAPTYGWAANISVNESDICPGGDIICVHSGSNVELISVALESGPMSKIAACDCKPGDANGDGTIDISDAVYLIAYIFSGGPAPIPYKICSGDANCDCTVDISDVVYLISYIFSGGAAPCTCEGWVSTSKCGSPLRK
jgi:predicted secreted hydrolase